MNIEQQFEAALHDCREGYPAERYAHDALVAVEAFLEALMRQDYQGINNCEVSALIHAKTVLRKVSNG